MNPDLTDRPSTTEPPLHSENGDPKASQHKKSSSYATLVAGAILVLLGVAWLADVAGVLEIGAAYVLPTLLALVGLALIFADTQGSSVALSLIGIALTIATVVGAVAPSESIRGGVGDRLYKPNGVDDLEASYELAAGQFQLDLSDLEIDDHQSVEVMIGAGDVFIILPSSLPVLLNIEVGAGELILFDEAQDGVGIDESYRSDFYDGSAARIEINVHLGLGKIQVETEDA